MKRKTLLKSVMISSALSMVLIGCGSTTATNNNDNNTGQTQSAKIDGKAIDGYLQYATVCLDINQDGYCQNTEPNTQTDANGAFTLNVTSEVQAQENYDKAMLLVYGGKDVDTGVDFTGKLLAPKDGTVVNVTPITTLVAKEVQKELKANQTLTRAQIKEKIKDSRQKVAQALDIHEGDMDKDPVAEQKAGNEDLIKKSLQLQKAVEAMLIAGDNTGASKDDRAEAIYEALIDGMNHMDASDKGVDKLLDKTLQRAQTDEKVKELIGGDAGIRLGDAAKKVSQNIKERFDKFDPQERKKDDFLEKMAAITKDDLQTVKIEYDNGSDNIAGKISIDDNNPVFQAGFDWDTKYIKNDLADLGIENPSDTLIEKIKALYHGHEKIRPGILFIKKERLSNASDPDLKNLYLRIKKFEAESKAQKQKQEATKDNSIVKITPPMSIFTPEDHGYSKITFNENNTLTFQKYEVQDDGTFAAEQTGNDQPGFIYSNGAWATEPQDSQDYQLDPSGAVILPSWNEKAYLVNEKDISGDSKELPGLGLDVTMPEGAKMSFIKIEKTADTYSIDDVVQSHNGQNPYTSIPEFIQGQCGMNWFMGDNHGGLAFEGTQTANGYNCNPDATSGTLVAVHQDPMNQTHIDHTAGKWEIKQLDGGTSVLVVKPYDLKRFDHDKDGVNYPIFTVKDGKLYRGDLEPAGSKFAIPSFNETAMNAINKKITENWESIKDTFTREGESSDATENTQEGSTTEVDTSVSTSPGQ